MNYFKNLNLPKELLQNLSILGFEQLKINANNAIRTRGVASKQHYFKHYII